MRKKRSTFAGRALLAVVLMIGFYVLALGICGVLVVLCWLDLEQGRRIHPRLWIFAAVAVGVVLWSLWPRKDEFPDPGVPLSRERQPRLWQMVEDIARRAGQEPPRKIFLVPEINAFVAERNSRMGFGGERIMGLGLPLLQVLTVPELQCVIAHEFGHFDGGDTRLGPFIYRTREAIARTVVNLAQTESFLHKPFEWYGTFFLKMTFAISRAQEYAADALSVRLIGAEPARTALRRVNEVGPLYDYYLDGEFFAMLNHGVRPPLADGFAMFLESRAIKKIQVDLGEQAMQARGNPFDSHPPLPERLAAVDDVEDPGGMRSEGPPAIGLLQHLEQLESVLLQVLTGKVDVVKVQAGPWSDMGKALADGWVKTAAEYAPKVPTMRAVDLPTHARSAAKIAHAIDKRVPTDERQAMGVWVLGALFAHALHQAGFQVETGPGDPIYLVRGEQRLEPFDTVKALCEGKAEDAAIADAAWLSACELHGIQDLVIVGSNTEGETS